MAEDAGGSSATGSGSSQDRRWTWEELVLACDLLASNRWVPLDTTHLKVVELAEFMKAAPLNVAGVPRSVNSIRLKMANIERHTTGFVKKPTRGGKLDGEVFRHFDRSPIEMHEFAESLRLAGRIEEVGDLPLDSDRVTGARAVEGRALVRLHTVRERNGWLKGKKIEQETARVGRLSCQVCDFDFGRVYGKLGEGFIECHHVVPLSASGSVVTTLDQLALICSNCHRMIHRRTPWLTPEQLAELIRSAENVGRVAWGSQAS